MILPIRNFNENHIAFKAKGEEKTQDTNSEEDYLLENNLSNRTRIGLDKFTKAFTIFPAKGIKGSRNSNFYEFLSMGTVPYVIGSITLMSIFNSANKMFNHNANFKASQLGNKMALGVLFYGLFKEVSKSFINTPIKLKTGIDTEIPYAKVNHLLQDSPEDYNLTSIEYHKVGESVDFPRWDQLYGKPQKGESLNFRYDKIAKKIGLGENLNDSDQEVKPVYKEVLVKSKLAKSISSFLWAATGVALAFQDAWQDYFNVATFKVWKGKEFANSLRTFGDSFIEASKQLWTGGKDAMTKFEKHSGKAIIGVAALSTILGVANTLHLTKKPSKTTSNDILDKSKEKVEG